MFIAPGVPGTVRRMVQKAAPPGAHVGMLTRSVLDQLWALPDDTEGELAFKIVSREGGWAVEIEVE